MNARGELFLLLPKECSSILVPLEYLGLKPTEALLKGSYFPISSGEARLIHFLERIDNLLKGKDFTEYSLFNFGVVSDFFGISFRNRLFLNVEYRKVVAKLGPLGLKHRTESA